MNKDIYANSHVRRKKVFSFLVITFAILASLLALAKDCSIYTDHPLMFLIQGSKGVYSLSILLLIMVASVNSKK